MAAIILSMFAPVWLACNGSDGDTGVVVWGNTEKIGVVQVAPSGPYRTNSFEVGASAHWVNTGVFLRAGESLDFSASGIWGLESKAFGPEGDPSLGVLRGCARGALAVRSGLRLEGDVRCLGEEGTFTAETDDVVYMGMLVGSDFGESRGSRVQADGALQLTVVSNFDTVPTVSVDAIQDYPFDQVSGGWVEIQSRHFLVTAPAEQVMVDLGTAQTALESLDLAYEIQENMRGGAPFLGQRIRWYPDDTIGDLGPVFAGNPIRAQSQFFVGDDYERILRAGEPQSDLWRLTHELGHVFGGMDGLWFYQYAALESWPNLLAIRALDVLNRSEGYNSYCDGRDAYLALPEYEELSADAALMTCFLKDFESSYGDSFYDQFFRGMQNQSDAYIQYDGTDESTWTYVKGRFDLTAGQDTSELFERWGVPVD